MKKEIDKLIKNYAHDYRDMKMNEKELTIYLTDFFDEIRYLLKINQPLTPGEEKFYEKTKLL